MKGYFSTKMGRLKLAALLEGVAFILLIGVAAPLKHIWGQPQLSSLMGPVHGLTFIMYVLNLILCKIELGWHLGKTLLAILASFVPFAPFYVMAKMIPAINNEIAKKVP